MGMQDVLVALSNLRRRELLERLVQRGSATVAELAEGTAVSRQAVLKQLRFLQRARLVTRERDHNGAQRYRVSASPLRQLARALVATATTWEERQATAPHVQPDAATSRADAGGPEADEDLGTPSHHG